MSNPPVIQQFELLWLQAIPSIAAIYYFKYLTDTHILHCPDVTHDNQITPRSIGKEIHRVIKSNEKRVAIYFLNPCSQIRRDDIFKFILKLKPDLSAYCLTIPSTLLQSNLLLGWSAGLENMEWKRRCAIPTNPEAFQQTFVPPTKESGQSSCLDFSQPFVISNELFQKQALIVNLRDSMMVSFDVEQGIIFTEAAKNSILGWIDASTDQTRTLIFIIDERKLYSDLVYNVPQERRDELLRRLRFTTDKSIQEFNSILPIYSYVVDYFDINPFHLLDCLSQIQHRHYICISQTIFLAWSTDDSIDQGYFSNMKCFFLINKGTLQQSKWISLHQRYIKEQTEASKIDKLNYISSDILGTIDSTTHFRTPLLSISNTGDLTKIEFFSHYIRHCVSAKSLEIFDSWATNIMSIPVKPCPPPMPSFDAQEASGSQPAIDTNKSPMDRIIASLTLEAIGKYVNNNGFMDRAHSMLAGVQDALISIDTSEQNVELSGKVESSSTNTCAVRIKMKKHNEGRYELLQGYCPCPLGKIRGKCKHSGALLLYIQSNSASISMETRPLSQKSSTSHSSSESSAQNERDSQESYTSSSQKRSYGTSQEQENTSDSSNSKKRTSYSQSSDGTASTVAYDPSELSSSLSTTEHDPNAASSSSTVAYDPNSLSSSTPSLSTDEERRQRRIMQRPIFSPPEVPVDLATPSPTMSSSLHFRISSNSGSSQSQSSSGLITLPSLPSTISSSSHSGSLSDNTSLRASLNIIVESSAQEEEAQAQDQNNNSNDETLISQPVVSNLQSTSQQSNSVQDPGSNNREDLEDTLPIEDTTGDESSS